MAETKFVSTDTGIFQSSSPLEQGRVVEDIDPKIDIESFLGSMTRNIGGALGIFSEPIYNSDDHGAKHIWITMKGERKDFCLSILDDGVGMGPQNRRAFMGVGISTSRGDKFKRGRHGLGTKRMYAEFEHCEVVDVSAKEKDAKMRVMTFSWNDWLRKLKGDKSVQLPVREIKRDPLKIGLQHPESTGVRIQLAKPRGDRRYEMSQVIDELANYLPPWVAEKVFISADGRSWQNLRTREIAAEKIEFIENHALLGKIFVHIYIPKRTTEGDVLRIGAMGPVCDFSDFRSYLPPHLKKRIPRVYDDPLVNGIIDVSAFNEYTDGSRKSFDVSLFEHEMMSAFVDFLDRKLADTIEERLHEVQEEVDDERHRSYIRETVDLLSALGGKSGEEYHPPSRTEKPVVLSVKHLELLPDESESIKVTRHSAKIKEFSWNDERSGGTASPKAGNTTIYTAGKKVGEFELICFDADNPEVSAAVKIDIVPKRQLRISPSQATLELGESITFRARNVEDDTSGAANLRWRSEEPAGNMDPSRGDHIVYTAGYDEGTFLVTCFDRVKPNKKAEAIITVVKEKPERDRPGEEGEGDIVNIEGIKYKIHSTKATAFYLTKIVGNPDSHRYVEIYANFDHPVLKHADLYESRSAVHQIIVRQALLHHIELTTREPMSVDQVNARMAALHEKIALKKLEER